MWQLLTGCQNVQNNSFQLKIALAFLPKSTYPRSFNRVKGSGLIVRLYTSASEDLDFLSIHHLFQVFDAMEDPVKQRMFLCSFRWITLVSPKILATRHFVTIRTC